MGDKKIVIKHPEIEKTATTTRQAFETLWQGRGWAEVHPATPVAVETLGHEVPSDLGRLTREELDTVAVGLGLDPSGLTNKGDVVDLINQTLNKE